MTKLEVRIHRIRSAEEFDASASILCNAFGPGSYTAEALSLLASKENILMLGAVSTVGDSAQLLCVGMADREPSTSKSFSTFSESALLFLSRHRVGHLFSMAVEPAFRARGIGKKVAKRLLDWLSEAGCDLAAAASWVSGDANQSAPALERLGFRSIAQAPGENYRQGVLGGRPCPSCGIQCVCFGLLFVREL